MNLLLWLPAYCVPLLLPTVALVFKELTFDAEITQEHLIVRDSLT